MLEIYLKYYREILDKVHLENMPADAGIFRDYGIDMSVSEGGFIGGFDSLTGIASLGDIQIQQTLLLLELVQPVNNQGDADGSNDDRRRVC